MRISNGIQNRNRRMRNRTYGGVRGRKTKVGRKLLRFPPTRFFAWVNLFLLNHILLYSLLLPFQSIQTYVAGFLFFEWSISFAYSHPFVCFV